MSGQITLLRSRSQQGLSQDTEELSCKHGPSAPASAATVPSYRTERAKGLGAELLQNTRAVPALERERAMSAGLSAFLNILVIALEQLMVYILSEGMFKRRFRVSVTLCLFILSALPVWFVYSLLSEAYVSAHRARMCSHVRNGAAWLLY